MFLRMNQWFEGLNEQQWKNFVIFSHCLFAFFIFSPFFLLGQNIVGSTDNLFGIFPNMLFNQEAFQRGEWGLWNPYILGGIDFSASTHNFIFYPINWLIFIFPQKYFFLLMTLRMFMEAWLVGVFGYLFFNEELGNRKWAFFSSTTYQLCGYTFFAITTYANLTIYLFITVALYVIWTLEKRKMYLSYMYLVFCVATFFLSGNIVYGITATLITTILFIYKHWPASINPFSKNSFLFYGSMVTAILISMARILPVLNEVLFEGARIGGVLHLGGTDGHSYLGTLAFVPEIMGVNLSTSVPIIEAITHLKGAHAQFHGYNYFGALPMLLLLWAAIKVRNKRILFWGVYFFIASSTLLLVQPISDIVYLMLSPCVHTIVPKMMIPVAFCTIVGYSGMSLESDYLKIKRNDIYIMGVLMAVAVSSVFLVWGLFQEDLLLKPLKVALSAMAVLIMVTVFLYRRRHKAINKILCGGLLISISAVFFWYLQKFVYVYPGTSFLSLWGNKFFLLCFVYLAATILILFSLLTLLLNSWNHFLGKKMEMLVLGVSLFLLLMFCLNPFGGFQEMIIGVPAIASLGVVRFLLVSLIFLLAIGMSQYRKDGIRIVFVLFYLVLIVDLLSFNKIYAHQVTQPFFNGNTLYPQRYLSPQESLDIKNFRVNSPNVLLPTPGTETNIFEVYKIRNYGGVNSSVFKRSSDFLHNFIPSALAGSGIYPNLKDERYLDLMGCRYDANDNGNLIIRPNSLSRFMLFKNFEVVHDDNTMLEKLKKQDFKPTEKLLLEVDPHIPAVNVPAEKLQFSSLKTDKLDLDITSDAPALVFFNDSFHKGWEAYVNGIRKPVIRADFNFMAVAVPAGTSKVTFRFHPKTFTYGLYMTFAGGLTFIVLVIGLYGFSKKNKKFDHALYNFNLYSHLKLYKFVYLVGIVIVFIMVIRTSVIKSIIFPKNVSVSSNLFPAYAAPNLIYGGGIWHAETPVRYPEWVEIACFKPVSVNTLAIQSQADSEGGAEHKRAPKDFFFQGSNDRHHWVNILSVKNNKYTAGGKWKRWSFKNNVAYAYYRLYITANNGDPNLLTIQQIKLKQ